MFQGEKVFQFRSDKYDVYIFLSCLPLVILLFRRLLLLLLLLCLRTASSGCCSSESTVYCEMLSIVCLLIMSSSKGTLTFRACSGLRMHSIS